MTTMMMMMTTTTMMMMMMMMMMIEFSLGGSSPYTGTDNTNKNKIYVNDKYKSAVQTI
jgi:ABC-type cobalt transport system substrate-binding protein